jgi:hypothetical protein
MIDDLKILSWFVVSLFRSKGRLEAEIVILRHQLNVLHRGMPSRARLTLIDRLIFVWLYRLRPSVLNAVVIVQPCLNRKPLVAHYLYAQRKAGGMPWSFIPERFIRVPTGIDGISSLTTGPDKCTSSTKPISLQEARRLISRLGRSSVEAEKPPSM